MKHRLGTLGISTAVLISMAQVPSTAGPNANGTLIVHAHRDLVYCNVESLCGQTDARDPLLSCGEAVTNHVGSYSDELVDAVPTYRGCGQLF